MSNAKRSVIVLYLHICLVYRVGQRNPEVSLNRLSLHMRQKIGGERHAPGLPVYQLSIDTTFVGYISFICPR